MKILLIMLILSFFTLSSNASEFRLMGTHLLEYSIFKIDIYQISYFKSSNAEKLVLDYKYPVKKDHSIEGWKFGLKHKLYEEENATKAKWFFDHCFDVKKGDRLTLLKKEGKLEIYLNDELKGKTNDDKIMALAFEPWLGENPVDVELKEALLGKQL